MVNFAGMRKILGVAPILPAAVGIVAGIVVYEFLPLWVVVFVLALAVGLYLLKWKWTGAGVGFVAVGMLLCGVMQPNQPPAEIIDHKVTASGRISSATDNPQSVSLIVTVDSIQHVPVEPFKAQVTINSLTPDLEPGTRVDLTTAFSPLPGPPMLPGDADLSLYYKAQGITALAFCTEKDCRVSAPASGLEGMFNRARSSLELTLLHTPLMPECKEFLLATLLADDAFLPPSTELAFRRAGVSHLLALSGLHVGIVVMIVMMLTLPLNIPRWGFYLRPAIAVVFVWSYALMVGMPPSVVRAAIMTSVYMLARIIQRGHTGLNSLLVSIVFILAIRPMWVYSVGFQLSVAAVASILAFSSLVPQQWQRHPVRYYLLMTFLIPVAAMLGTGMIAAIHFSTFPLLFLPSNLAVGVLAPWILGLGAVVLLFAHFGWHLVAVAWVTSKLYALLSAIVTYIGNLPMAEVTGFRFPALIVVPYAAAVVFLWLAISGRSRRWTAAALGACVLTWLSADLFSPEPPAAELYILPEKDATKIVIAGSGPPALILPDAKVDSVGVLTKANLRHSGYLNLRGARDGFALRPTPQQITIGDVALRVLFDSKDTLAEASRPTYLLVCKGFRGSLQPAWRNLRPDTILFSPALNPRTATRLMRESGDTIPIRNLRLKPFKIVCD